jgi:hypothetical protein
MAQLNTPFQPYSAAHRDIQGPGDARPTAFDIVRDCDVFDKSHDKNILITGCSGGLGPRLLERCTRREQVFF